MYLLIIFILQNFLVNNAPFFQIDNFDGIRERTSSSLQYVHNSTLSVYDNILNPADYLYTVPDSLNIHNILENPIENWSNSTFEIYRYKIIPEIIIIDTLNYSLQSIMFKRLAFFVEKKGYVGKIYTMDELGNKNDWNGHDYNAVDLAEFFNRADYDNVVLTNGEEILKNILTNTKVLIQTKKGYSPGVGAVISISRSTPPNLRYLILRHEIYHGLYFTSDKLRNYVGLVWEELEEESRKIITMFLDSLTYDVTNKDLLKNEFLAYLLQRDEKETYEYFNSTVYNRLLLYYPNDKLMVDDYFKRNKTPFSHPIKKLYNFIKKNISDNI